MPRRVQGYSEVAEYSEFMSTTPAVLQRRHRRRLQGKSSYRCHLATIEEEASEWYEAFALPLKDVQAAIRRMQVDPAFSQDHVFSYLFPIVILGALFVVTVIAVREDAYIHTILASPDNYWTEVGRFVALAVCGVVFSVASLKCIIYGFAELCAAIVSMETQE